MVRVVDALQFAEQYGEVCPAGWKKGEEGMKPTAEGVADYLKKHSADLYHFKCLFLRQLLEQLEPLPIDIRHCFRIIGNDDVIPYPGRRPALFDHFIDLFVNPVPVITGSLGVE